MHTPHPSLVPIEMASAGLLTVTSTFAPHKTAEALAGISPNLLAAEPTVEAVAAALGAATAAAGDAARRVAGATATAWPRDWACALDDALMAEVERLLSG
jgi:hypothetical protein